MAGIAKQSYAHVNVYTYHLSDEDSQSGYLPLTFITVRVNLFSFHVMITTSQASILSKIQLKLGGFYVPSMFYKRLLKIFPLKNKSCANKLPQTQWLKMIQIYDLTVV